MSYAATGVGITPEDCGPEEDWDPPTRSCVQFGCPAGWARYYSMCLDAEDQERLAAESCGPDETWYVGTAACFCKPGLVRNAAGNCVAAQSLAPGEETLPSRREAGARAGGIQTLAVLAALAGAGAVAYYYLSE